MIYIMSDIFERLKTNALNGYTQSVSRILERFQNIDITNISIHRVPLRASSLLVLNLLSLGDFYKRLAGTTHDKLFHLYMIIDLSNGLKYVLEKNAVITLRLYKSEDDSGGEGNSINIPIKTGLNLRVMLDRTRNFMSPSKYYRYSGYNNNCQVFIDSILSANNINSEAAKAFVLQDTKGLFQNDDRFRKVLNSLTDIGAVYNKLTSGSELINGLKMPFFYNLQTYNRAKLLSLNNISNNGQSESQSTQSTEGQKA